MFTSARNRKSIRDVSNLSICSSIEEPPSLTNLFPQFLSAL